MEKCDTLSNVMVFKTGLYNVYDYSPFTEFCLNRNIKTVEQLFKYIDKRGIDEKCLFVKKEIEYLINLFKYKYLFKTFNQLKNLDIIIQINNDNLTPIKYEMKYGVRLSELGFNQEEVKYLSSIIKTFNSSNCTIGELFMYIEEKNFLTNELNNKSLINKISLLNGYYRNKLSINSNLDNNFVKNNINNFKEINNELKTNDSGFYNKINTVLINECNLISEKSLISHYCEKYNINTLGELVRKYENHELLYINLNAKIEIDGLISLIKIKYNKNSFIYNNVLFGYIYIMDNVIVNKNQIKLELKKLGFNINEIKCIFEYVLKRNKSMVIIDALIGCRNYVDFAYRDVKVLYTKIDLIIDNFLKKFNCYKDNNSKKLILEMTGV